MDKVFVVILNWNRANDTLECLKSVAQLSKDNYQLSTIVVDNGSTDDSVDKISNFITQVSNPVLVQNGKGLGYTGGMNVGIRRALQEGADYVCLLNNDTILDENLLKELLRASKKYKKAGVVCPKIYFAKGFEFHRDRYDKTNLGKVIWYAGGEIDWENIYGKNRGVDEVDIGQYDKREETDYATGACMFINAHALRSCGMLDEKYYLYFEDVELCTRFHTMGWKIIYEPRGIMWHKVAQSSGIGSELNDYFITRNRLLFGLKYAPLRARIALMKESVRLLNSGRKWQKIGVKDFYLRKFGKGSWLQ